MYIRYETWIVKDSALLEEHDEFLLRWFKNAAIPALGKKAPIHRLFSMTDPKEGRALIIETESKEKMDEVFQLLRADETFRKYSSEFKSKYIDEDPVNTFMNSLKQEEIDLELRKVWE